MSKPSSPQQPELTPGFDYEVPTADGPVYARTPAAAAALRSYYALQPISSPSAAKNGKAHPAASSGPVVLTADRRKYLELGVKMLRLLEEHKRIPSEDVVRSLGLDHAKALAAVSVAISRGLEGTGMDRKTACKKIRGSDGGRIWRAEPGISRAIEHLEKQLVRE